MKHLVCLLEEPSADVMIKIILPKILPQDINLEKSIVFDGKQDLEKNIEIKLKRWQKPDTVFLILRDQDSGDCVKIKKEIIDKIQKSGKASVSIVRIACHELESFYLGDLDAVEKGFNINHLAKKQKNKIFRNPDHLANAKQELKKLTNNNYQPIAGSRALAEHLKLDGTNKSTSFNNLLNGIKKVIAVKDNQ